MDRREFLKLAAAVPAATALAGSASAAGALDPGSGALGLVRLNRSTARLRVIDRAAWGALPAGRGMKRHRLRRLTVHHADVRLDRTQGPATARSIQQFHMGHLGHADTDYHFLVDRAGYVYEARNPRFVGDTQTEYDPTGHFLVCCLGDYEGPEPQRLTAPMMRSLTLLLAWAAQRWDVSPGTITGHRDHASTSCPGKRLYRRLPRLREQVAAQGRVEYDPITGRAGRRLVRAIEQG